jgi:uncharacterized protein
MITMAVVGLMVGILSSITGLGGGFMVVPFLIYLGRDAKLAVGTSFVFVLLVAISSLIAHYRLDNVDIRTGVVLAVGGVLGAQIGPQVLQHVSDQNVKKIFSVLMVITAVWMFADSKN